MLQIDFKEFFRDRVWFGWTCTYTIDGVGKWELDMQGRSRLNPIRLRNFEIDDYKRVVRVDDNGNEVLGVHKAVIK